MLLWFNLATVQVALATVVSKLIVWFLGFLASSSPRNVTHCHVQEVNEANGKRRHFIVITWPAFKLARWFCMIVKGSQQNSSYRPSNRTKYQFYSYLFFRRKTCTGKPNKCIFCSEKKQLCWPSRPSRKKPKSSRPGEPLPYMYGENITTPRVKLLWNLQTARTH